MPAPTRLPALRYRRRILAAGLITAGAMYSLGAPFYVRRIETDLERRVPIELASAGFDGVSAEFSGQDGTLRCQEPLSDPSQATEFAYSIRGVRSVELDRTCRVNLAPLVDGDAAGTGTAAEDVTASTLVSSTEESDSSSSSSSAGPAAFATVAELVAADPRLSYLSLLLAEAGIDATLAGTEPITLFAPADAAFDGLPADVNAQLRADPQLLSDVLARHITAGALMSTDLADGPLAMADGSTLDVLQGNPASINGVVLADVDLFAGNGVVHVLNGVLLPDDLELTEQQPAAGASATLGGTTITLEGVVNSEVERARLVQAARSGAAGAPVVDQLTVDPGTGLDAATSSAVAQLIGAMRANLVDGVAGFDGDDLYVRGTYATEAGREAVEAVAADLDIDPQLEQRPPTSDADAAALEQHLNSYVASNPVAFEPGQGVLSPASGVVVDEIANQIRQVPDVVVVVEGHTDSDGDAARNTELSTQRAEAVRLALVARSLPEATIVAEGFGSQQPVLVGGIEDKAASRRVEFRVTAA